MHTGDIYDQIEHYSSLLKKYFEGVLSMPERRELAEWLRKNRKNQTLFRQIKSQYSLKDYYDLRQKIDPAKEFELLTKRCTAIKGKKPVRHLIRRWAAAVILLLTGTTMWYAYRNITKLPVAEVQFREEKIIAILKTSGGSIFQLDGSGSEVVLGQTAGLQIRDSLKELICEQIPCADSCYMHELTIPRGGEYKLILSDGTKVWLNSESEIRFPGVFNKAVREITLCGEAYLEVTKDEKRPFRVKAGEGRVEVLGTSFGMSIYPNEQKWSTVLVSGKVKVCYGQNNLLLQPGKEAFLKNGKLEEQVCDTDKELAWVKGLFIFKHDRLEDVVKKLSRWYNVNFRFENEKLKDYIFTGQASRDIGINKILDLMERMNVVNFEDTGTYILIKEKNGKY